MLHVLQWLNEIYGRNLKMKEKNVLIFYLMGNKNGQSTNVMIKTVKYLWLVKGS
jgi:hypothetical protein